MKGFVVLAALMLVPTIGYFQTQAFQGGLQGELAAQVEAVLVDGGVEDGEVRVEWRDVTISGLVGSSVQRESVVQQVEALKGVRLARTGNQLQVRGWVKIVREDGVLTVAGLLPKGGMQFLRFLDNVKLDADELRGEVSRAEWVAPPAGVMEWNEFVAAFFDGPGSRQVDLRGGKMIIGGETTPELRTAWLARAAEVVGEEQVKDELTVLDGIRDFDGYVPKGIENPEVLRRLRDVLASSVVEFAPESTGVTEEEQEKVAAAAAAIVDLGGKAVFLIEGYPRGVGGEGVSLGVRRSDAVKSLLIGYGVRQEQLEVVAFGAGEGKTPEHRVEISVK